ncbi:DUF4240 domain-containing protein [Actinoplanes sp. DH11]|uniref:DUF4240 domain-containing protein n=1 Tax=Actinoplanes sp. DH11 TaxID=2857011 RepID=UPI001E362BDE|nr:DUF4240 domain-containing protein [Actinoplanes sp. DH11]
MDEDKFWQLVAECRQAGGTDTEVVARLLFRRLRVLDATEVAGFLRLWERARTRLYGWPVADAACLLLGPVEEEDLAHIQDWIISYGRAAVDRIAADPDGLVDLAADAGNAREQWFGEFTTEAYILVTGAWPPEGDPDGPDNLTGERVDLGDPAAVERRFPRLAAYRRDHPGLGVPGLH